MSAVVEKAPDCAGRNGAHTPGPWAVGSLGPWGLSVMSQAEGEHICDAKQHSTRTNLIANASLIAVSPDLLAAAISALAYIYQHGRDEDMAPVVDALESAIASATVQP